MNARKPTRAELEARCQIAEERVTVNDLAFNAFLNGEVSPSFRSGHSQEISARTLADALREWGAPQSVNSAEAFELWLERCGGYGGIQANGVQIANVRA